MRLVDISIVFDYIDLFKQKLLVKIIPQSVKILGYLENSLSLMMP